jgi:hypothetical protein
MSAHVLVERRSVAGVSGGAWRGLGVAALLVTLSLAAPASAQSGSALLAAAEWRVGVERLAKLQFERMVAGEAERAQTELLRERSRIEAALGVLKNESALSARRRGQILRATDGMTPLLAGIDKQPRSVSDKDLSDYYQTSEALAAQLSFVSTGLSNEFADADTATMVDMLTRAATMALRVGKLSFAAGRSQQPAATVVSDARQTVVEFRSALEAIGERAQGDAKLKSELDLVRNQWIMFSAALNADGLAKDPQRLPQIATTTDRIAQSLVAIARRIVQSHDSAKGLIARSTRP